MTVPGRRTLVDGEPASYREAGAGPTAVIAAGLGLSSRFYEESYGAFATAGVRLLVPDLPGRGVTPGPHTGLSPQQTARFLCDFAAALGISRAVWIGHSIGAQAVVEVALRRPDLTTALVLVGPTGAPGRGEVLRQVYALAVETRRTTGGVIRAVARDYLSASPVRYLGSWLRHGRHDLPARVKHVRCPALILVGSEDPVCRADYVEQLQDCLPQSRVEWVCGATHALPRGHAAAFNRAVTDFVRAAGQ
jgi:pimeloyl-ACP methyl ester carboxylesterase